MLELEDEGFRAFVTSHFSLGGVVDSLINGRRGYRYQKIRKKKK